jgi:two-component system, NtrC family, sensor kinase
MGFRLASKYVGVSCAAFLVIMLVFAFIHVVALRNNFFQEAVYEADSLGEMLQRNTYYLMLDDDRTTLQQIIDEAGEMQRIEKIRVFGRAGIVKFSTDKAEIGATLTEQDEGCVFCHVSDASVLLDAPAEDRSRIFQDAAGKHHLSMIRGIYNEPNCFVAACHFHSEEEKKLGILEVVLSLETLTDQLAFYRRDIFIMTFVMLLIISICQYLFTRNFVAQPINNLLQHTKTLASGNLSARMEVGAKDEIGELGQEFNMMADNLAVAQQELCELALNLEKKVEDRTTEIKQMQNQLLQSAKLASMGQLVAGIAHEINNPLSGILIFASLAAKTPELPDQTKENLDVVISETSRCAKIVRDLLKFSRESIPEKRRESIFRILEQSLNLVSQQPMFHDIEIQVGLCQDMPEIYVDADQLQQVFFNLFVNAGQAMPKGGALKITTEFDEERDLAEIKISDTGSGIPEESLDKIFDPFFSTKAKDGVGLGLSITYGIIKNHGGEIKAQNRPEGGAEFVIRLPVSGKWEEAIELVEDGPFTGDVS